MIMLYSVLLMRGGGGKDDNFINKGYSVSRKSNESINGDYYFSGKCFKCDEYIDDYPYFGEGVGYGYFNDDNVDKDGVHINHDFFSKSNENSESVSGECVGEGDILTEANYISEDKYTGNNLNNDIFLLHF